MTPTNTAKQITTSLNATMKKNPDASVCACIRALSKAMKQATRGDFLAGCKGKASPGTISRQFYEGRA